MSLKESAEEIQSESAELSDEQILENLKAEVGNDIYQFISKKISEEDRKVQMFFKCFRQTKDQVDFINSMQVYYYKLNPIDPIQQILKDIQPKVEEEVFEYIKQKLEDKKVKLLFKIFQQNND
jgi:hypothetical protein